MQKQLTKGNEAIVKAAVLAGCRAFYGYPITPASAIAEAAALYLPLAGASVVVVGNSLQLPPQPLAFGGALLCFAIRMLAIYRRWHFPVARTPE